MHDEDLNAMAVGAGGTILVREDGSEGSWRAQDSGTMADLYAITPRWPLVVGAHGTILYGHNGQWTQRDSGTEADLRTITFFEDSDTDLIAAGDGIVLMSKDIGKSWVIAEIPDADLKFRAVGTIRIEGPSPRWEVVVVGEGGRGILSVDSGATWATIALDTEATLTAVGSVLYQRLIVYGEDGTKWIRDGGDSGDFRADGRVPVGVQAISSDGEWLAFSDGTVLWTNIRGPNGTEAPEGALFAIDGGVQDAIAVGENGAIVRMEMTFTDGCGAI